jgi:predicted NACHT family NTPase
MPLAEAAFSLIAGRAIDVLRELRKEARAARVQVDDSAFRTSLLDHLGRVERWSASISMLSLLREKRLAECFVELGFDVGLSRFGVSLAAETVGLQQLYDERQSFAVLGGPGAGKTTTLQRIAHFALADREAGTGGVPIVVRLRDLRANQTLVDFLLAELGVTVIGSADLRDEQVVDKWKRDALVRALDQLSALLLVDGLEEVDAESRLAVERDIAHLAQSAGEYRLGVTCRTAEYRMPFA